MCTAHVTQIDHVGKYRISEQEWTLHIRESNSFLLQMRKLKPQEVKQLAADPLGKILLVFIVPYWTLAWTL